MSLPIETQNPLFGDYKYPEAKVIMEAQQDIFWTAQEIDVTKDIMDYKVNMSKEQYFLASTTLSSFVDIESSVGTMWATIASWFPHSEIEGACSFISAMETSVHAFFYQKMNDVMNISPEDTYATQQETKEIREKLAVVENVMSNLNKDRQISLATILLVEQVLLFGNFALLKSFQANGYNLITNTITGIDFVSADEDLHGEFAAYLFKTRLDESNENIEQYENSIIEIAKTIVNHEVAVVNLIFKDVERINHLTAYQVTEFIKHRANRSLEKIGIKPIYEITDTSMQEWFYRSNNSMKIHDFFVSGTSSYKRDWSSSRLSRIKHDK